VFTFVVMGNDSNTKFVRIDRFTVELVEESKGITGVPVGTFFEQAAMAKLSADGKIKMPAKKNKKYK